MKKLEVQVQNKIIAKYQQGISMKAIGQLFDVSITTVFNVLKRYGIQTRTHGGIYKLDDTQVCQKYKKGMSCQQIADQYKVTFHTISSILQAHSIVRDNRYKNTQLREDYFSVIDSPDKAYYLGFLITDGNVLQKTNAVRLSLHTQDTYILQRFRQVTKNGNPLYKRKGRQQIAFNVKSVKWKKDLAKYGVIPRKTFQAYLPILDEEMMPHLIRGMIDGDGWVSYKSHNIGYCGNKAAVQGVRDYLVSKLGVYNVAVYYMKKSHIWGVQWSSKQDVKVIGQFLYKDKGIYYLTRKFQNFCKLQGNTEVTVEIAKGSTAPQSVGAE